MKRQSREIAVGVVRGWSREPDELTENKETTMFQVQYHKRGRAPDLYWVNGAVGETHTIALRRALDDIIKDMDADGVPCEVTHLGDDVYQVRDGNSGESIQFDTIRETCYHLLGDDYDSIRVVQLREDDDNG